MKSVNLDLFKKALQNGYQKLVASYKQINAINFFEVDDFDTGTNMLLTMKEAFSKLEDYKTSSFGIFFKQLLEDIISEAQGNSGLIISQFFVACKSFFSEKENKDKILLSTYDFKKILFLTEKKMKSVVVSPILKGTMIFVMMEGNRKISSEKNVLKEENFCSFVNLFLEGCEQGLEKTKFQQKILEKNNVVDSGGKGLVVFFSGFSEVLNSECDQK